MKKALLLLAASIICISQSNIVNAQDVQNTFFNMRLGNVLSTQTIRNNVGTRGKYGQYENRGSIQRVIFVDISFGAEIWTWGDFQLTNDGHFFEFTVENAYSNKVEAEQFYTKMKQRLFEKYSNRYEENRDSGHIVYFGGGSDSYASLELKYRKANSGDWLYYVDLSYWSGYWINKVVNDTESEL